MFFLSHSEDQILQTFPCTEETGCLAVGRQDTEGYSRQGEAYCQPFDFERNVSGNHARRGPTLPWTYGQDSH